MRHLEEASLVAVQVSDFIVQVTPLLPFLGTLLGATVVGAFAVWNRKRGAVETRAPDVNEIWVQQDRQSRELDIERKWRRRLQNYSWEVLAIWRGYVRRVQNGGSADLTPHERLFYDSEPPTEEINIKSS